MMDIWIDVLIVTIRKRIMMGRFGRYCLATSQERSLMTKCWPLWLTTSYISWTLAFFKYVAFIYIPSCWRVVHLFVPRWHPFWMYYTLQRRNYILFSYRR